jgi:hypothetical protein
VTSLHYFIRSFLGGDISSPTYVQVNEIRLTWVSDFQAPAHRSFLQGSASGSPSKQLRHRLRDERKEAFSGPTTDRAAHIFAENTTTDQSIFAVLGPPEKVLLFPQYVSFHSRYVWQHGHQQEPRGSPNQRCAEALRCDPRAGL